MKNCNRCLHQHTIRCPNSFYCYSTEDKPFFEEDLSEVPNNKKFKRYLIILISLILIILLSIIHFN